MSWIGKGDLAKAKKDLTAKDEQIAQLKEQIAKLQAERATIVQRHKQELAKLRNGYQTEIDKAIKEEESLRKTIQSRDARIERQSKSIAELDRQAPRSVIGCRRERSLSRSISRTTTIRRCISGHGSAKNDSMMSSSRLITTSPSSISTARLRTRSW